MTNQIPKITVIVPIYKVEKYLIQCLESILNNTLKDIEVFLLDQGDLDACRAIIDMYATGIKKDPRVKAIHEPNNGYGAKINKGLSRAQGEYISIIEPDDFIEPTMFEEMYNYAKKLDADVVKAPYYEYKDASKGESASKKICAFSKKTKQKIPADKLFSIYEYPFLMQVHASLWTGLYKRSYLQEKNIRFIEATGSAYVDVGWRIDTFVHTDKIAWHHTPFYNYRVSNESSSTNSWNLDAMLARWEEAHEKFLSCPDIYNKIGNYLFYDEYHNTIGYILTDCPITEKTIQKIRKNLSYIPDSIIKSAEGLSKREKKLALDIKQKNKKVSYYRSFIPWYHSGMKVSKDVFYIHIFKNLRIHLVSFILKLGDIYTIEFSIGRNRNKKSIKKFLSK